MDGGVIHSLETQEEEQDSWENDGCYLDMLSFRCLWVIQEENIEPSTQENAENPMMTIFVKYLIA